MPAIPSAEVLGEQLAQALALALAPALSIVCKDRVLEHVPACAAAGALDVAEVANLDALSYALSQGIVRGHGQLHALHAAYAQLLGTDASAVHAVTVAHADAALKWISAHPYQASFQLLSATVLLLPATASAPALAALGFGPLGPVAGTLIFLSLSLCGKSAAIISRQSLVPQSDKHVQNCKATVAASSGGISIN